MPEAVTIGSFDAATGEWERLLPESVVNTPFQTLQWQRVWMGEMGGGAAPVFVKVADGQQTLGMASLRRDGGDLTFIGSEDLCDYNDFLLLPGHEQPFFEGLLNHLETLKWDALRLFSLAEESPTLKLLPAAAESRVGGWKSFIRKFAPAGTCPMTGRCT